MNNCERSIVKYSKCKLQNPRIISKSPVSFNIINDFDSKFENKTSWISYSTRKSSSKKEREFTPYRNSQPNLKMRIPLSNISDDEIRECF